MQSLDQLNERFGSANRFVTFDKGSGGLTRAVLKSPKSEAHVYLHGAHVTHFAKAGEPPVLFLSAKSSFEGGKPIRGGVPICFPWFGPRAGHPDSPMHGFARLVEWTVSSAESRGEQTSITLVLKETPESLKLWPHKFTARYTVTISDQLALELDVTNTGTGAFAIEEALHTYFAVSDIKSATVEGLGGADYIDKTDAMAVKTQGGKPMRIVEETDRIYLNTQSTVTINDAGNKRKVVVAKENSDTTVVWNPWIAKAKAMADFGDDEWPKMLCVETCNVNAASLNLDAGATHTLRATIGTQRA
jgi:D-hexose-6-phosphate mutarotase